MFETSSLSQLNNEWELIKTRYHGGRISPAVHLESAIWRIVLRRNLEFWNFTFNLELHIKVFLYIIRSMFALLLYFYCMAFNIFVFEWTCIQVTKTALLILSSYIKIFFSSLSPL
jgi:hypothetical protein